MSCGRRLTTLVVPSRCPAAGAKGLVGQHELYHVNQHPTNVIVESHLTAGSKVLALGNDALVVVDIVLPAVLGLVLVGEAGIEAYEAPKLVSTSIRISEALKIIFEGGAWGLVLSEMAYQLRSVELAIRFIDLGGAGRAYQ